MVEFNSDYNEQLDTYQPVLRVIETDMRLVPNAQVVVALINESTDEGEGIVKGLKQVSEGFFLDQIRERSKVAPLQHGNVMFISGKYAPKDYRYNVKNVVWVVDNARNKRPVGEIVKDGIEEALENNLIHIVVPPIRCSESMAKHLGKTRPEIIEEIVGAAKSATEKYKDNFHGDEIEITFAVGQDEELATLFKQAIK